MMIKIKHKQCLSQCLVHSRIFTFWKDLTSKPRCAAMTPILRGKEFTPKKFQKIKYDAKIFLTLNNCFSK